ncbi:MAG TPA: ribbon-helix-helix domain-containing protein, partial [Stellaceae bacterium]|nr:ribbon-helix-helix domain-containing protein [Stellaceae bacterium]
MRHTAIVKRSVRVAGHATSISLEAAFWQALRGIAAARGMSVNALVAAIDESRGGNLSSA